MAVEGGSQRIVARTVFDILACSPDHVPVIEGDVLDRVRIGPPHHGAKVATGSLTLTGLQHGWLVAHFLQVDHELGDAVAVGERADVVDVAPDPAGGHVFSSPGLGYGNGFGCRYRYGHGLGGRFRYGFGYRYGYRHGLGYRYRYWFGCRYRFGYGYGYGYGYRFGFVFWIIASGVVRAWGPIVHATLWRLCRVRYLLPYAWLGDE